MPPRWPSAAADGGDLAASPGRAVLHLPAGLLGHGAESTAFLTAL